MEFKEQLAVWQLPVGYPSVWFETRFGMRVNSRETMNVYGRWGDRANLSLHVHISTHPLSHMSSPLSFTHLSLMILASSLSKFFSNHGLCQTTKPAYYNCLICECLASLTRWETSWRERPCFVLCWSTIGLENTMPYLDDSTTFSLSLHFMKLTRA